MQFSLNGEILNSFDLSSKPNCVRVDRNDNTVWIISDNLYKYTPGQTNLETVDNGMGFTLTIDQYNELVWVASAANVKSYTKRLNYRQ